jgi:thiosulfate/3-mercaptopyruvate sulfurtransferase
MPNVARNADKEFLTCRIPGAVRWNIDEIADKTTTTLPHMFPTIPTFLKTTQAFRINENTPLVVYDSVGVFSAPRVWYTLLLFGAQQVAVLQGGLPQWKSEGFETLSGPFEAPPDLSDGRPFKVDFHPLRVRSRQQVLENVKSKKELVVDARPSGRFDGTTPEPRKGLKGGHIPGSKNIPFGDLVTENSGQIKPTEKLTEKFEGAVGQKEFRGEKLIFSCGSGITAAGNAFAAHLAGKPLDEMSVYDGSWTEWGDETLGMPVATTGNSKS